jgi:hypothetical protein
MSSAIASYASLGLAATIDAGAAALEEAAAARTGAAAPPQRRCVDLLLRARAFATSTRELCSLRLKPLHCCILLEYIVVC